MINGRITALLLVADKKEAKLIKQQIHRSAQSAVTLTAYTIEEFAQKLSWFPTTFVVVENKIGVGAIKTMLRKTYGQELPLVVTSADKKSLAGLPLQLKIVYDRTSEFRSRQEGRRVAALHTQKHINRKKQLP